MPKMPETKKLKVLNFVPEKMDLNAVAYTDKAKEDARQTKLLEYQKTGVWPGFEKRKVSRQKPGVKKLMCLRKGERRNKDELRKEQSSLKQRKMTVRALREMTILRPITK